MISITCTSCRTVLEIDDAFAGGVCRCQHCGTIQTVPAHLKGTGKPAAVGAGAGSKSLYQGGRAGPTGLEDLSGAVLSSGLARTALATKKGARAPAARTPAVDYATPPPRQRKAPTLWVVLGGVTGVFLMAVVVFLFFGVSTTVVTGPAAPGGGGGAGAGAPLGNGLVAVPAGPHVCGVDLSAATGVVYVLDRGSATVELFDTLKAATYRSIES